MGKLLDQIEGPADLKELPAEKLVDLAAEIRERITEVVGRNGGHLASNLGAVELTIALHRVFDFSADRIVFDVGHQAYTHKLLTGRNDRFDTLRTRGGLSGFPNPGESSYDPFVVGHASTALGSALGLVCSAEISSEDRRVVAVVGDGSITGGLWHEGLNQAGHLNKNILVVLNDNEMAIAPTVGALQSYLGRLRARPLYNTLRDDFTELLKRVPIVGRRMEAVVERGLTAANRVFTPGHMFQEMGFRYFGPVDGHDFESLVWALENVRKLNGPIILHVLTEKGRGFEPATSDPEGFHSATPEIVFPQNHSGGQKREPYTKVFSRELLRVAAADGRVVAITAAMPAGTGLDAFEVEFPARYFDVGIAEAHAMTFASGLAAGGLKPVVVVYSTFLQRAYDQILHDVCLQPEMGVVIAIDRAGVVGADGPTHHGIFDIPFLRHMPRMVLAAPKDAPELGAMLEFAVALDRPVAIRYPRDEALEIGVPAPLELGRSERLREGGDCTIIGYGAGVDWALGAAEELAAEGVQCAVVNARFAKPIDEEMVRKALAAGGPLFTVEDGTLAGGFGAGVLESAAGMGLGELRLVRLGVPDRFIEHGGRAELLEGLGLSAAGVAGRIRKELGS